MDFTPQPDMAVRPSDTIEFKALLLVDDDKQLASALQWILADENFLVDVANDGDEALMKVKANEYDAVVYCFFAMRARHRIPREVWRILYPA